MIRSLDLEVSIYRDRVQLARRGGDSFVDQPAQFPFSTDASVVAHARHLEDTLVRAMRQLMAHGGFSLHRPIAHVVRCDGCDDARDLAVIEAALREIGMAEIVFELAD